MFQCKAKDCRKQFSTKVGTIFEDSPLGLDKWFVAVWCIVNAKNGISSYELSRALGVTQKSCWHMLHRVRLAMQTKSFHKMSGEVEVDETFVGGLNKNRHKSKRKRNPGSSDKAIVQGLLERGGEVRCHQPSNLGRDSLQQAVRENVEPGSHVYTDQAQQYVSLNDEFIHQAVNHIITYVQGRVHTNSLENFWSLLKRTLGGTYVAVAPKHLNRYLDEQAFRFNKRKGSDATRFLEALLSVCGKRLSYADLTKNA
jgi:transposase-like protein